MQFLSITGPKDDFDRVIDKYLSRYEIQLENALSELKTVDDLKPFVAVNPYRDSYTRAEELIRLIDTSDLKADHSITAQEALHVIKEIDNSFGVLKKQIAALEEERNKLQVSYEKIVPFRGLDFDVSTIIHFKSIKFRFGRIAKEYIEKYEKYVYDNLDTVFYKCHSDEEYVWGVCFIPSGQTDKIDAIYKSMHFERIFLPDEYEGTPEEAAKGLQNKIEALNNQIQVLNWKKVEALNGQKYLLFSAYTKLKHLSENFDIRKLAACTENHVTFYILCGWMSQKDAKAFSKEIENDDKIYCIIEQDEDNIFSKPPTKLKNPKIFKPFEMFIKMYGLPNYNEFDPTIFVSLTYAFIFGWMFGDVGQGLCLAIGGFLLYHFKKINLAAIVGYAGIFSTFFGFMFGSFFGFEDILEPIWLRPATAMSNLPFIGKLNTVFVYAIAFGMILVLITMLINIINGIKTKNIESAYLGTNGVAGFVFYAAVITVVVLYMTGHSLPAGIVLAIMFGVPLIIIALKEPIARAITKKKETEHTGAVMFVVQTFFEMFEVLLSYFSNTLSFVRIGAFAVSHAAMMEVVLMLAGAENGGSINWLVVVLGNIFVCGMEGLIVGIQVLRLEYYEFFSRFYKGDGREFKPYTKAEKE